MMKRALILKLLMLSLIGVVSVNAQTNDRPYLGLVCMPVDDVLASHLSLGKGTGLVIAYVDPNGPTAETLKPNDVIISLGGKEFRGVDAFKDTIASFTPGTEIQALVIRGGVKSSIPVKIGSKVIQQMVPLNLHEINPPNIDIDMMPEIRFLVISNMSTPVMMFGTNLFTEDDLNIGMDVKAMREKMYALREQIEKQLAVGADPKDINNMQLIINPNVQSNWIDIMGTATNTGMDSVNFVRASVSTMYSDGDVTVRMTADQNGKKCQVKEKGVVIFDGSINTPEEEAKLPEKAREILKKLKITSRTVNINNSNSGVNVP